MIAAFDLDAPFESVDAGDRDEHLVAHLRREKPRVIEHEWDDLRWIAMTDRRDAIRMYARLGLHPIALRGLDAEGQCTCRSSKCLPRNAGKHPVVSAWQSAPLDLEELDAMLVSNWRLNVGLRMGRQPDGSFLVTVDVDGPRELLEPLERMHGRMPPTLTAQTGSGGLHFIYRVRPGVEIRNRQGVVPHVDIRGEGGQIVAAPSLHRSGNRYTWINICEPAVLP